MLRAFIVLSPLDLAILVHVRGERGRDAVSTYRAFPPLLPCSCWPYCEFFLIRRVIGGGLSSHALHRKSQE